MPVEILIKTFLILQYKLKWKHKDYMKRLYTDIARFMVNLRNIDDVKM